MQIRRNGCCQNFSDRDRIILSLHPHNDRGTGVAATELTNVEQIVLKNSLEMEKEQVT